MFSFSLSRTGPDSGRGSLLILTMIVSLLVVAGPAAAQPRSVEAQSVETPSAPERSPAENAAEYRLTAHRVDGAPTIDGRLDEPEWQKAEEADGFTQYRPAPGAAARNKTQVRILYTNRAMYVGARMHTGDEPITARYLQRDEMGYSDQFTVLFDSYNDNRTAFAFTVNPRGSKIDQLYYDDTRQDDNWNAVWRAEVRVGERGWVAEMRIPMSQLRFRSVEGEPMQWGLNFMRRVADRGELLTWAPLDPNTGKFVSRFGSLEGLENLRTPKNLEVRPYVSGRLTQVPDGASTPLQSATALDASIGGDVQYGLTSSLSLRGTINPDFGQVEADPSQINLTAFETFFPEKRPFFVKGADAFRVQGPRLFYSRRIGGEPAGAAPGTAQFVDAPDRTTIPGAVKLTGQTEDGWQVGALNAVTAQESAAFVDADGTRGRAVVAPTTNYGVARVQRTLRSGGSAIGGVLTATNRPGLEERLSGTLHRAAYAGGVDGRHRFLNDDYQVSGFAFGSQVRGSEEALLRTQQSPVHYFQRPDAGHLTLDASRTQLSGWSAGTEIEDLSGQWRWEAGASARSPGFEINDLGFMRQSDEVTANGGLTYQRTPDGDLFRSIRLQARSRSEWTYGGEYTDGQYDLVASGQLANHYTFVGAGGYKPSSLSVTALRGGPALRQQPEVFGIARLSSDPRRALEVGLESTFQSEVGTSGYTVALQPSVQYRVSDRAKVSLEPQLSLMRDTDQYVRTVASDDGVPTYVFGQVRRRMLSMTTRFSYTLTPEMSLQAYAQPFVATGDYQRFSAVSAPKASDYDTRFDRFGADLSRSPDGVYSVERPNTAPLRFGDPDFTFRQLRSTLVYQWEYRRGSTLYVVWNREQTGVSREGTFRPASDLGTLFGGGRNTVTVKLNFWLGL